MYLTKLLSKMIGIVLVAALASHVSAQMPDFSKVEIKTHKVTDNIYMLEGMGGNIGLFFGHDGAFMIDTQFAALSKKISTAISKLTDEDIRFLINTHIHGDHVGGNANFGKKGALIFAHENARKRMQAGTMNLRTGKQDKPAPTDTLPLITLSEGMDFHINGEQVSLVPFGSAHTDGDVFIHFTDSNVIHTGDVFRTNTYPVIDVGNGGSFHGIIAGLDKLIELSDNRTRIIPGHGFLTDKKMVTQVRDMYVDIRNKVMQLMDQGKSLDEIQAANVTAQYDERWNGTGPIGNKEGMVKVIYNELGNI